MKIGEQKQYDLETFNGLYPLIREVLSQVELTDKTSEYIVNGVAFQIRQNAEVIEMGLPIEAPIFPTLAFSKSPSEQVELLHYRISKEFKNSIFDATEKFVVGNPKVSVMFTKALSASISNVISYESTIPNMFNKIASSSITLEIENLISKKLESHWDRQQPNANKLFTNRIASLVIYCGDIEAFGKNMKQAIQVTDDSVFIMWRAESVEYLTSIANSLRHNNELFLRIDLDEDDNFFADEESMYKSVINKISITFN